MSQTKDVLRDIDEAFKSTHGDSPGFSYLKDCYENFYDVVLDEAYDKSRILWGVVGSPLPTNPHKSLVQHDKTKSQVQYYPNLILHKAVGFAEKLCEQVIALYQSSCTDSEKNRFRSAVKNWNMDTGYWIDVKMDGNKLNIIWRHTWC
ncbi:hypothetical protein ACFLU6_08490 [Acidobacteriota bacterium]